MHLFSWRSNVFYLGIIILIINSSAFASPLKIERFSNKEGFNQNTICAIERDQYGFLWIGTPNGLIKYDGYEFKSFVSSPSTGANIAHNYINCLFKDKKGLLWIGTRAGLNVYIPWLEKFLTVPLTKKHEILHVGEGSDGRIWICGVKELYNCKTEINGTNISFKSSQDLLQGKHHEYGNIFEFCFSNDSTILLSTATSLVQVDLNQGKGNTVPGGLTVRKKEPFADTPVYATFKDNNIYWVAASDGLHKTVEVGQNMHIIKTFNHLGTPLKQGAPLNVLSIYRDMGGAIWIGTRNHGIGVYNREKDEFVNYTHDPKNNLSLSSPMVNCFFQDRFNIMWIGTAQGGLNKFDLQQKNFNNYANNPYEKTSLSGNLVTSILEDSRGYLWVSSYNMTLSRSVKSVYEYNEEPIAFERVQDKAILNEEGVILKIYEDKKGFIWFGTTSSIIVFNPLDNSYSKLDISNCHSADLLHWRVIEQIDDHRMLFGGRVLLVVENPWEKIGEGSVINTSTQAFFDMDGIACKTIVNDSKNRFWLGTTGGIFKCRIDSGKVLIDKCLNTQSGDGLHLSSNSVFSLYKDQNANIWAGTFGGGLNKLILDAKDNIMDIKRFRKGGVLQDDVIYGIIQQDDQHLWLSTDMGLCRMNIKTEEIEVFDVYDGLPNNNFRQGAYFKGESGNFYFGGLNGLTVFKPDDIKLNKVLPSAVITSLAINNSKVIAGDKIHGRVLLPHAIIETDKIILGHTEQVITLDLAVQHSASPLKNRLSYKLEGFDSEWIEVEAGKKAVTYMNLPDGEYLFKVKAANGDGLWNEQSTNLVITVLPPWYKTWWFYCILFIIIMALIAGVAIYIIQMVKLKHNLEFEQKDKQRMDAINQSKLLFFTNISHEFRTPLTLIAAPLERLIAKNTNRDNDKYLTIIQNNTNRLLQLVDQLITFRRVEQGHLELNYSKCSLGKFIYPITEAFENFAMSKNINFFYKVGSPEESIVLDINKMERILFNLLSNAFKFTSELGSVSIEAEIMKGEKSKLLVVSVVDDGRGIPLEKINKVFERFYQLEGRRENIGGTGIGLALCKSLAEIMEGDISVESEAHVRTCFRVSVPCDKIQEVKESNDVITSSIQDWIPAHVPSKPDEQEFDTGIPKSGAKIIIVEDEPEVRSFLQDALSEKYIITMAENGLEGYEKIKEKVPDLVISDVLMPKMNGFELCQKIKNDASLCHVPVILLTALGDKDNEIKGVELGADDYISKPFSLRLLQVKVEKLIENNARLKNYFSQNSMLPDSSIDISIRDKEFLNNIISSIEKNLSNSHFGVEELSKEIGLSTSQFYRRLKQLTGQIPNAYLRNFRLQRAAKMMRENTGTNIAEIMYEVGFESSSYFSTAFKKLLGCTPTEYQRKYFV